MKAPPGLHIRDARIEGIGPWLWIASDKWAWDHPASEFGGLRDLVLAHTREPKVIIQAGGCMGMYPRLWSESFDTVYTFEPEPLNFYCLVANCQSERIVKMQAALSDARAARSMHRSHVLNSGAHWLSPVQGMVPALPLDAFAFSRVDAVQLDCEGHEAAIVQGAIETLRTHKPVLSIEAPNASLRTLLGTLGYVERGTNGTMPDVVFAAA